MSGLYSNPAGTLDVLIGGQTVGQFGSAPTVPTKVATAVAAGDATRFDQVIGLGQSWQAVTRTSGTTYTNSTGKAIVISWTSTTALSTLVVAGVTVIGSAMVNVFSITSLIPVGATYVLTFAAGSQTCTELR